MDVYLALTEFERGPEVKGVFAAEADAWDHLARWVAETALGMAAWHADNAAVLLSINRYANRVALLRSDDDWLAVFGAGVRVECWQVVA